ncbi:MAG: hypothetical protein GY866_09915 [Proteobacteria bacterium]|nr:hypothetical protein [Pseudomonadota bacterium]
MDTDKSEGQKPVHRNRLQELRRVKMESVYIKAIEPRKTRKTRTKAKSRKSCSPQPPSPATARQEDAKDAKKTKDIGSLRERENRKSNTKIAIAFASYGA